MRWPRRDSDATDSQSGTRFLLKRVGIAVLTLWVAATMVFLAIHLGPRAPVDASPGDHPNLDRTEELDIYDEKKAEFGLYRPLTVQYADYMEDMFTFDFGQSWTSRGVIEYKRAEPVTDVNKLIFEERLPSTLWLWCWTLLLALLVGIPLGVALGYSDRSWTVPGATVGGALLRALPVIVLVEFVPLLSKSEQLLFGFDWGTFLAKHHGFMGPLPVDRLHTVPGFKLATKQALPFAFVLSTALVPTAIRLGQRAVNGADDTPWATTARANGVGKIRRVRRGLRRSLLPMVSVLADNVGILIGATIYVEVRFHQRGVGRLFAEAVGEGDFTTVQAVLFLFAVLVVGTKLLESLLYVWLTGAPADRNERAVSYWTGTGGEADDRFEGADRTERLRSLYRTSATGLPSRISSNPRPLAIWVTAGLALFCLEAGAAFDYLGTLPLVPPLPDLPTLTSRSLLPSAGYRKPGGGWAATAFGLPPAYAWGLRAGLVYLYGIAWVAWAWVGYRVYRSAYREADRTPLDAALGRFRRHRWGMFGAVVVFFFLVSAVFAPTLAMADHTGENENTVKYIHEGSGVLLEGDISIADRKSASKGSPEENVGVLSYDPFGRFHPLGTNPHSRDEWTRIVTNIRPFFVTGFVATLVGVGLGLAALLLGSRFPDSVDALAAVVAETTGGLPLLPMAFFLVDQFDPALPDAPSWNATMLMAAVVGVLLWPSIQRTLRAPLTRALDAGWVDATRVFDEPSRTVVRRHVLPRVAGYLLAYAALLFVGTGIALQTIRGFLGGSVGYLMTNLLIAGNMKYLPTVSWHVAVVPTTAAVLIVLGFVALADGILHAVDPDEVDGMAAPGEVMAAGGAG